MNHPVSLKPLVFSFLGFSFSRLLFGWEKNQWQPPAVVLQELPFPSTPAPKGKIAGPLAEECEGPGRTLLGALKVFWDVLGLSL